MSDMDAGSDRNPDRKRTIWMVRPDLEKIESVDSDLAGIRREMILTEGTSAIWPTLRIESLEELLRAFKKILNRVSDTLDLTTCHVHPETREVQFLENKIEGILGSDGTIAGIRVVSERLSADWKAKGARELLDPIDMTTGPEVSRQDLADSIGQKLLAEEVKLFVMQSRDRKTARLVYLNFPREELKKILSVAGKESALKGIPIDEWRGVMLRQGDPETEYWEDLHSVYMSRLHDLTHKKKFDEISQLVGRIKTFVVPLIREATTIGSCTVFSEHFMVRDLEPVTSFARRFCRQLLEIESDL